jgi:hypothetical protein
MKSFLHIEKTGTRKWRITGWGTFVLFPVLIPLFLVALVAVAIVLGVVYLIAMAISPVERWWRRNRRQARVDARIARQTRL